MNNSTWRMLAASGMLTSALFAQNYPRQAAMVGGGGGDQGRGKCTVEVVVDGAAQVEIRGTSATLRTTSGRPAQWRRFECTSPMPASPQDFRFAGVDGRGRQSLVRDPRNGGVALIEIEDKDNGAEGYTFDIFWDTRDQRGPGPGGVVYDNRGAPPPIDRGDSYGQYRPNYRDSDYYRRYRHGFSVEESIRICEQAVRIQASRRFPRAQDMHFHRTAVDTAPGRQEFITGVLDVHRGNGEEQRFPFSCSVDFESGRVRTADLDSRPLSEDPRWRQ